MKRRATLAALLLLATAAIAADGLPDAPSVQKRDAAPQPTFNRQLWTATAVHGAVRVIDEVHTCQNLASGGHEYSFPVQNCGGVVALNSAVYGSTVLGSYLLAKHGHRKLAVAVQYLGAAGDSVFILVPRAKWTGPVHTLEARP